jgi:hypothetical protein
MYCTGLLSVLFLLFLAGCSPQQTQEYEQNKEIAKQFVLNSEEFKNHLGFDINEPDPSMNSCGTNCFEFNLQYSTLGEIIGYKSTVVVQDGIPEFSQKPTALN